MKALKGLVIILYLLSRTSTGTIREMQFLYANSPIGRFVYQPHDLSQIKML